MPAPRQQDVTLETINQQIWTHLEERDWHRNSSRSLAISIALEASELLEHYQWGDKPVGSKEDLGDELADVFIYAFELAQQNDIDIAAHITRKLEKAAKKYPADKFKGKTGSAKQDAWLESKLAHKKEGL